MTKTSKTLPAGDIETIKARSVVDATSLGLIDRLDDRTGFSVGMFRGVDAFPVGWPRELAAMLRGRGDYEGAAELLHYAYA